MAYPRRPPPPPSSARTCGRRPPPTPPRRPPPLHRFRRDRGRAVEEAAEEGAAEGAVQPMQQTTVLRRHRRTHRPRDKREMLGIRQVRRQTFAEEAPAALPGDSRCRQRTGIATTRPPRFWNRNLRSPVVAPGAARRNCLAKDKKGFPSLASSNCLIIRAAARSSRRGTMRRHPSLSRTLSSSSSPNGDRWEPLCAFFVRVPEQRTRRRALSSKHNLAPSPPSSRRRHLASPHPHHPHLPAAGPAAAAVAINGDDPTALQ